MLRILSITLSVVAFIVCTRGAVKHKGALPIILAILSAALLAWTIYDSYYTIVFLVQLFFDKGLYQPESFRLLGIKDHPTWVPIANCITAIILTIVQRTSLQSHS